MKKHSTMLSSLMVVLVLILTGCRGLLTDSKPASVSASGKSGWNRNWNEKESKYTKADYELALSFRIGRMKKLTTQRRRLLKGFQPACLRKMRMQISFFGPCSPLGGNAKRSTITPVPIAGRLGTAAG